MISPEVQAKPQADGAPPSLSTQLLADVSAMSIDARALDLTDERFMQLCRDNRELRFELTPHGELIIMGSTSSDTGRRNAKLNQRLANWAEQDGTGLCFDSSAGFTLPDGAKVSPDASWVRKDRYEALTQAERESFAPLCPDFVVELRSKSDRLALLQTKMSEYVKQGARLGWLIDPTTRTIYVYRPQQEPETLNAPATLTDDTVLPGFVLRLEEIW
jgi:Uma2 family endonuclease